MCVCVCVEGSGMYLCVIQWKVMVLLQCTNGNYT